MGTRLKDLQGLPAKPELLKAGDEFARQLQDLPPGREKSLALTKLDEALLWANQALDEDRWAGSTRYEDKPLRDRIKAG